MTTEYSDTGCIGSGDALVQVKAQVMSRDDSSGGWVPVSGGGMSIVALMRYLEPDSSVNSGSMTNVSYVIVGHRITDQAVVLNCMLKVDVEYVAANPTFHHWRTDNQRYGLTFQSAADARAFEKSLYRAIYGILQGPRHLCLHSSSSKNVRDGVLSDEDIFMMLRFSQDQKDGQASAESSPVHSQMASVTPHHCTNCCRKSQALTLPARNVSQNVQPTSCDVTYISEVAEEQRRTGSMFVSARRRDNIELNDVVDEHLENDVNDQIQFLEEAKKLSHDDILSIDSSYVRFAKTDISSDGAPTLHEYCYPTLDSLNTRHSVIPVSSRTDLLRCQHPPTVPLPTRCTSARRLPRGEARFGVPRPVITRMRRRLCIHCGEWFNLDSVDSQHCQQAPDKLMACINVVTCTCVADAVVYHCLADEEGEYEPTCSCSWSSAGLLRGTILVLLSLVLPCLCCFWPLVGCRRCAARCGCCINPHEAA